MSEKIKMSHACRVFSEVARMRESGLICDFKIKVGGKDFSTHRTILAASSDYFKTLFSSETEEAKQGFMDMKDIAVKGVEQSLEFMYTGNTEIALESVDDTLHAADFFQLDFLQTLCFQYLEQELSPSNCLAIANIAEKYNCQDIRNKCEGVIIANLKVVMSSDMFPQITRSDLLRYISKVEHQTSWQAALTWAKDGDQFCQLVEVMDIQKFPFNFMWKTVLEEPLIKQSAGVKNKVIKGIFSPQRLRKNLAIKNCIQLKNLACEYNVTGKGTDVITQFLEENFEGLAGDASFKDLSKQDLILLLRSARTRCSFETVKWGASLKWVKHDLQQRMEVFSEIFQLIKLDMVDVLFAKSAKIKDKAEVKGERSSAATDGSPLNCEYATALDKALKAKGF